MEALSASALFKQIQHDNSSTSEQQETNQQNSTSSFVGNLDPAWNNPPVTCLATEVGCSGDRDQQEFQPCNDESDDEAWGFDSIVPNESNLRGGGCATSVLCDKSDVEERHTKFDREMEELRKNEEQGLTGGEITGEERDQDMLAYAGDPTTGGSISVPQRDHETTEGTVWKGWAELENDPDIFTILLQEWGMPNVLVNEVLDMTDLIVAVPEEVIGLIFLSRYISPDNTVDGSSTTTKAVDTTNTSKPWFANQISKFSCGTVALMNILMNSGLDLSKTLSEFKHQTISMDSKHKGVELDGNARFRDIHNSFSTHLDRMVVDVLLKEEALRHKQRKQAEARQGGHATKKRKRGGARFTKRRRKAIEDDEENGFHFVAYIPTHNIVWKLDGMQVHPCNIGVIDAGRTWLNVAAEDLLPKLQEAQQSGQECSLMSVTKATRVQLQFEADRKQEDWAPFIEYMLRLHCEKGNLQELVRL